MTRRRLSMFVGIATAIGMAAGSWALTAASLAAPAPKAEPGKVHWSFIQPQRVAEPAVKNAAWTRNPIDRFVLARLEQEKIKPAAEASRETLIRRVSLDLTGLPPSPAEVDAFLADTTPAAYEKVVDRLLASPHYGERWGRHWLDVARYADSNGYSQDHPRVIWKYRDWVISAVNRDLPFDQFVIEQFAGDLLPNATEDQIVATGFHRNTQNNEEGGIDPEQFRVEAVVDRVGTSGTALLGLSLACAQCHNHKYDPISQREYYEFYAFLNNQDEPVYKFEPALEIKTKLQQIEAQLANKDALLDERVKEFEAGLTQQQRNRIRPHQLRTAIETPAEKRTEDQRERIKNRVRAMDDVQGKRLAAERDQLRKQIVTTLVLKERTTQPRVTNIHIKGDFTRKGDVVTPGVPAVLPPLKPRGATPDRLDLARWIVREDNPLTARVMMNRVWQEYFGRGIVETENDFGVEGDLPTHPALLDWLATEFQARQWSLKAMHRLIVTSATYRQSSDARPELDNIDPYNKLLARQSRVRLDAEIVRDVGLVTSGLFAGKVGGPSVFPPQPPGVTEVGQVPKAWRVSTGEDRYRRGMYTFFYRATPHPLLGAFDAPDATQTCTRRNRSNTPLQALNLLNDEAFVEFSRALAMRILREAAGKDDASQIDYAFRLCTSRQPSGDERQTLIDLLASQREAFKKEPAEAKTLLGNAKPPESISETDFAAWTIVGRVLLNLDETITRE